jgi:DNA-binding CsgD family transcriptional regulator
LLSSVAGAARKPAGAYAQLTDRELQIFRLIGLAHSTRQIAEKLGVSVKTVDAHRENIKNKLGLENGAELVTRAAVWVREGGWR